MIINQTCQVCVKPKSSASKSCKKCRENFVMFVQKPKKLTPCESECVLNWKNRKYCAYCRLKKCLIIGMTIGDLFRTSKVYSQGEIADILVNGNASGVKVVTNNYRGQPCTVCDKPRSVDAKSEEYRPNGTCQACHAFFTKYVQSSAKKSCKGKCKLDWTTKSKCKFCRYEKCLNIGKKRKTNDYESNIENQPKKRRIRRLAHSETSSSTDDEEVEPKSDVDSEFKRRRLSTAAVIAEQENKFMCPDCLIEFDNCALLFQHLRKPHRNDYKRYSHLTDDFSEMEKIGIDDQQDKAKIECTICRLSIGRANSSRWSHNNTWHRGGNIDCPHCSTAHFREEWQLAVHLANRHGITVRQTKCDKCDHAHSYYRQYSDGRLYAYHVK